MTRFKGGSDRSPSHLVGGGPERWRRRQRLLLLRLLLLQPLLPDLRRLDGCGPPLFALPPPPLLWRPCSPRRAARTSATRRGRGQLEAGRRASYAAPALWMLSLLSGRAALLHDLRWHFGAGRHPAHLRAAFSPSTCRRCECAGCQPGCRCHRRRRSAPATRAAAASPTPAAAGVAPWPAATPAPAAAAAPDPARPSARMSTQQCVVQCS